MGKTYEIGKELVVVRDLIGYGVREKTLASCFSKCTEGRTTPRRGDAHGERGQKAAPKEPLKKGSGCPILLAKEKVPTGNSVRKRKRYRQQRREERKKIVRS